MSWTRVVVLAGTLVACGGSKPDAPLPTEGADSAGAQQPRALFVGIDGMRPDAMRAADTPHLDRLRAEGTWTWSAQTQLTGATSSAPGWTSIFTGVEVEVHGVRANGVYDTYDRSHPTFAQVARQTLGHPTMAVAHWPEVLSAIHPPEAFDESLLASDDGVTDTLATAIGGAVAHLYVAHLDDVDHAGHASGFSVDNPDYIAAIEAQDARLGALLAAIDARPATEDWLVVVTTDHGGAGTNHGDQNADCQVIPFVVWGGGAPARELVEADAVSHLDAFPTILTHLGATPDQLGAASGTSRVP